MAVSMSETISSQEQRFVSLTEEVTRGSMSLALFSKSFFPMFVEYFVGEKEPNLNFWFGETKTTGYQPVDILGSKGEVVFTVPPLYDVASTTSFNRADLNPAEHMALVQIKDKSIPGSGTSHADAVFEEIVTSEKQDEVAIRTFYEAWTKIFMHYGYTSAAAASSTTDKNAGLEISEDDFDGYDDI